MHRGDEVTLPRMHDGVRDDFRAGLTCLEHGVDWPGVDDVLQVRRPHAAAVQATNRWHRARRQRPLTILRAARMHPPTARSGLGCVALWREGQHQSIRSGPWAPAAAGNGPHPTDPCTHPCIAVGLTCARRPTRSPPLLHAQGYLPGAYDGTAGADGTGLLANEDMDWDPPGEGAGDGDDDGDGDGAATLDMAADAAYSAMACVDEVHVEEEAEFQLARDTMLRHRLSRQAGWAACAGSQAAHHTVEDPSHEDGADETLASVASWGEADAPAAHFPTSLAVSSHGSARLLAEVEWRMQRREVVGHADAWPQTPGAARGGDGVQAASPLGVHEDALQPSAATRTPQASAGRRPGDGAGSPAHFATPPGMDLAVSPLRHPIKPSYRAQLVDWTSTTCACYQLQRATFHLAVAIFDNHLIAKPDTPVEQVNCVMATALLMACKLEVRGKAAPLTALGARVAHGCACSQEIRAPRAINIAKATGGVIGPQALLQMEVELLHAADWSVAGVVTPLSWASLYGHRAMRLAPAKEASAAAALHLAADYLDAAAFHATMRLFRPSLLAACALFLGGKVRAGAGRNGPRAPVASRSSAPRALPCRACSSGRPSSA